MSDFSAGSALPVLGSGLAAASASYLDSLNPDQRQAVTYLDGPLLVLAGAGTGKTRVLTTRLAYLVAAQRVPLRHILAVTFTNKAAREMEERIAGLIGDRGGWIGTFHALCARILRHHAELAGLKSDFTILDTDDQLRLTKQVLEAANIDLKRWPPRGMLALIQRWKDKGQEPDQVSEDEDAGYVMGKAPGLYADYQRRLRDLNAVDFGDLILHCVGIFRRHADVLSQYRQRFRHILVDEYQDTNVAQYLWLRLLAREHCHICCVGDDDQSIYGWRGAEVGNILRFEHDFPGAKIVRLEQNYRSTPHILAAASAVIAHNKNRLGKTLWTNEQEGEKIRLLAVLDGGEEARVIGDEIESLQRRGTDLSQIAILVRAGFQTREFEDRFLVLGLPYRVIGGPRFYERREIRDALAYFRLLLSPSHDLAFERIINTPRRGIGDSSLQTISRLARTKAIPLTVAAAELLETEELSTRVRRVLAAFLADLDRWRQMLENTPHARVAEIVLDESGYTGMWQKDRSADAPGRLENLKELVATLGGEFETLPALLDHVGLVMDNARAAEGELISLMTLHSAKGLEFDTVFLPGWEEEIFPNRRSLDEAGGKALEEERRLAYVGLTRARHRAFISFAYNRRIFNKWVHSLPSRFVDELPDSHVERLYTPGSDGGLGAAGGFREDPFPQRLSRRRQQGSFVEPQRVRKPESQEIYLRPLTSRKPHQPPSQFTVGEEVFHEKFGYGTIQGVDGDKLEIAFETGVKKVMDGFVRKASL